MNYGEFQSTCIQEDILNGRKDISLQPMERQHDGTDLHTTACGRSPTGTDRYSHADEGGKCEEEGATEGNFYILAVTLRVGNEQEDG